MRRKTVFFDNPVLNFIGFFSFLGVPFSFTSYALDPSCHLGFVIWSFLSLGLGLWAFKNTCQVEPFVLLLHRKIFWAAGGFLLTAAFSLTRSVNPAEGIFAWLGIFLAGAFFLICSQILYRYPKGVLILSHWAVAGGMGLVALGLAGRYWDPAFDGPFLFRGIMVNKNLYASSLFLLLPFVIYCLVSGQKKGSGAAAVLLPVLCITLLLSLSRAVWLALILAALPVVLIAFYSSFKRREKGYTGKVLVKKSVTIALAVLCLILVCLFFYPSVKKSESVQLRLNLWNRTTQMIQNNLLFGVGPGQWRLVLSEYGQPPAINGSRGNVETIAQRPHNDFLWVAAETGVLGCASYLAFFGILYYYAFKVVIRAGPGQRTLALSMVYGISGYLIIAFFSYPRERPFHSLLMMLMAAGIVSSYHGLYPKGTRGEKRGRDGILKSAMVILLMVCCLGSGLRLYSEIQLKKALQARGREDWHQVIAHIDKAFLAVYSIDPFGVPLPWYRGMAHYHNHNLPMALKDFRRALAYHPYHGHSLNNLAIVEEVIKGFPKRYGSPVPDTSH